MTRQISIDTYKGYSVEDLNQILEAYNKNVIKYSRDICIIEQIISSMKSTPQNIPIVNRGTGAGGANTNLLGKKFEEITNSNGYLKSMGFVEKSNYLERVSDDRISIFITQSNLKKYIKIKENIILFRNPDEAIIDYRIGQKPILFILEKKEQNVEGSVETKLLSGPSFKREYEIALENRYEVRYAYCVNQFLKNKLESGNKKYNILKQILNENNIPVFYGDDEDYFSKFYGWFNSL